MIRCPICMTEAVKVVQVSGPHAHWRLLALADRMVAKATFEDWTDRTIHMVTEHGWSFHSGTLAERSK